MTTSAKILVCDHRGEGLSAVARRLAEAGHAIEVTSGLRQSLASLASARPDLALLDALAAGGTEAATLLGARAGEPPLPLLLVCDLREGLAERLAPSRLTSAPWDAIRRDAPAEEFLLRIERLLDLARRRAEMDELRHRAMYDDRTNLLRPLEFGEQLRAHFSAAQRHDLDLALLLVDLDRFGQVNKLHDHTVGDRIIERVGGAIREALRIEDVAGRLGGDEFAVLLPYTRKVDAASVAQRLLAAIRALSGPFPGARGEIEVSASIGFETFDGSDIDSADTLRSHAETALRHAKRRGGDQGVYYRTLQAARSAPPPPTAAVEDGEAARPAGEGSGRADQ
jgi:diguanylate cyclase (GGDEF)-like protein